MERFGSGEDFARELDTVDPLAGFRDRFHLPAGKIYMVGNSLGLPAKDSVEAVSRALDEWKDLAIGGWMRGEPPWFSYAERVGAMAAELVGASPEEVVATGTTTLNIHALVSTFYAPEQGRTKILADELTFPSALYALQGQIASKGLDPAEQLVLARSRDGRTLNEEDIVGLMDESVAVALLPSVLYRSAQVLDMEYLSREAHKRGIIIGFDCAHSVGAIEHSLDEWDVDFAVWCSYKHLNAGPGSTAFLYLNRRHFDREPVIRGWFGYDKERQFDLNLDFEHAKCAGGWQVSSPGILGIAACEGALKILAEAGIERVREKSLGLTSYFIYLVDSVLSEAPYSFRVGSPREPERRGGHVAIERDEDAVRIGEALKLRGVIGDFRAPNIIRIAPCALYNTYHEVWRVANHLKDIVDSRSFCELSARRGVVP